MSESKRIARKTLKEYADSLIADARAETQQEQGEAADNLIEVTRQIEENGEAVAELIYELLGQNADET